MTLDQLKSLKVGQVVKYTNDVDALNVAYWTVNFISEDGLTLQCNSKKYVGNAINFNDKDIDHIASMLTIDQPIAYKALEPQRQLKLIEAKIRDAEFAIANSTQVRVAYIIAQDKLEANSLQRKSHWDWVNLHELIEQRNALLCPPSDHTN